MIKRAAIYLRVSTGKQVEGASLDTQELMCQNWAARNKVVVERSFIEEGVSAKSLDRPTMNELLLYLENNKANISYLVTYQTDRLTRNAGDYYALMVQLRKMGIEYKNINSSVEQNTANDELIQGIEAVLAQHDNRLKSDRVTENMKKHGSEGYRMSKAPHGLRNARDVLDNSIVMPIPGVSENITEVLEMYSTGAHTIASLLDHCHNIGLLTAKGKEMSHQSLSKMLRQPLYAGLEQSKHTGGLLIATKFDGIITPAIFHKNQDILKKNKNTAARYKTLNPVFPLRNFVKCETCSSSLRGSSPTGGSGKPSPRYHCTGCKSPSIGTDELHKQFLHLLASMRPSVNHEALVKKTIVRVWQEELKDINRKERKLHRTLETLRKNRNTAVEKVISGELTSDEKDEYLKSVDAEVTLIKKQLDLVRSGTKLKEETIDYALRFMNNAPQLWSNSSINEQIMYQNLVFPERVNYDLNSNKFGTAKISPLYRLFANKKDAKASSSESLVIPTGVEPVFPG